MSEFEILSLYTHGVGFGCVFFMLVLIYWRQR